MDVPDDADCLAVLFSKGNQECFKLDVLSEDMIESTASEALPNLGPAASEAQHMPLRQMPVQGQIQPGSWKIQPVAAHQDQLMWQQQAAAPSMLSTQQGAALSMPTYVQQQHLRSITTLTSEGPSRGPLHITGLVPFAGNGSMLSGVPALTYLPWQAGLLAGGLPAAAVQPAANTLLQQQLLHMQQLRMLQTALPAPGGSEQAGVLAGRLPAAAVQPAANTLLQQQLLHMQQLQMLQTTSPAPGGSRRSAGATVTTAAPSNSAAASQPIKNRHSSSSKTHSSSGSSMEGVGGINNLTKAGAASRRYR
jgi:hypothetical protein